LVAIVACLGETTEGIAAAVLLLPVAVGEVSPPTNRSTTSGRCSQA